MDLSINNIQLNKKNLSFKGMLGEYNNETVPVYRFIAPPYDKDRENVVLEIAPLEKSKKTAQYSLSKGIRPIEFNFENNETIDIPQNELSEVCHGFGYRFKITDKQGKFKRYELDPFKSIRIKGEGKDASERMNVIEQGRFYGISPKGGTMRHSFLDSDVNVARLNKETGKITQDSSFVRNHFNKLGGSIKGLLYLLQSPQGKKELEPYRYFMTTPDIGVDKVSSHRYWPANHYQCSDLEAFKDFNFELFKQGKGYVVDGAFTSQGIQSPLVQHVLKWGEESPFYHWLKIDGFPSLGVLPDVSEINDVNPYDYIGVRLVNAKGAKYDKNKPTYIQFYDTRLLSEEKVNSNELHFNYDKMPEDHYDIVSHQDSIQPYAFEIDPNDEKIKAFNGKKNILLKDIKKPDDFMKFKHFRIVEKNKVGGVTCWDGNVDIIKMNLSNPDNTAQNRKGFFEAREYLTNVATYWTKAIQAHLLLETAKNPSSIKDIAKANDISPELLDGIKKSVESGSFVSIIAKTAQTSKELVEHFPLQTLETSEELSAIFAQNEFKQELFAKNNLDLIAKKFDEVLNAIISSDKNSEAYRNYVARAYGDEILRYIYVSAMSPQAVKNGKVDIKELKKVTLKSLESKKSASAKEERSQVAQKIQKGLSEVNLKPLQNKIQKEISAISLKDFQIAEALVLQGKGGLNWRFDAAKDIGDLDAVRNGESFGKIWNGDKNTPGVQAFWGDFVENIRKYNPSAYVINEVTSLNEFYKWENEASMRDFDAQLANAFYEEYTKDDKSHYENHVDFAKQVQFLTETNSTTTSEYDKGFNKFSEFAGVNPEREVSVDDFNGCKSNAGNMGMLKEAMESLANFNQPNSAIFSHMFVSNHDKPSVLHTMPLNMSIFMARDLKSAVEALNWEQKRGVKFLLGESPNYKKVCPKALAVGLAMLKTIDKISAGEDAQKMKEALKLLVNGQKTSTGRHSYKRAESFGVKPFEITIKDVIEKAGIAQDENDLYEKTLDFHSAMLNDSMTYFERMWQVMNACVGVPTLYGGNEFAQTGYETYTKNVYVGVRNEILHNLKDDPRYKAYYEKMHEISSLYKRPQLSALRNGTPTSCGIVYSNNDVQLWPVYKKDATGSQTISIISNLGLPYKQASFEKTAQKEIYHQVANNKIPLKDKNNRCPLPNGTILRRIGDNSTYVVNDGSIMLANGGTLSLNDTVTTFYVEKNTSANYRTR